MKIGKVIIGEQGESSEQYDEFCKIVRKNQISAVFVKQGDIINIEKDLKLKVLFPDEQLITENILNNNSLVMKLEYKNFSMLFTGDIEEIAEQELLKIYTKDELHSDILKVAHHGSKSSSTMAFLRKVMPSIAIIGVGENNNFGHPNNEVLQRLENIRG